MNSVSIATLCPKARISRENWGIPSPELTHLSEFSAQKGPIARANAGVVRDD